MENKNIARPRQWAWLILFASTGTLLCCALPILLVSLGMGAVLASIVSNIPFIILLSKYKLWMFLLSLLLMLVAAWALFRPGRVCPADPVLAQACAKVHKWNLALFWAATVIWLIGFVTAYGLQWWLS